MIAGVDEAGRGAIAGPITASAVVIDDVTRLSVDDSKKMTANQRKHHVDYIKEKALDWSIAHVTSSMIDRIGIQKANKEVMELAVQSLKYKPEKVVIDGNIKLDLSMKGINRVKADENFLVVGAASILAKEKRDEIMESHDKATVYGWGSNKGYSTRDHKEKLKKHGVSKIHRKSFNPVKEVI